MIENYIKEADRVTYLMPKEVDHHCAGQIIAELDTLIEGCGVRKIVFDMKQTEFMDSSGLGLILGRYTKAQEIGCLLILQNPTRRIRRIMEVSGIGGMIKTEETKSEVNENGKKTGK